MTWLELDQGDMLLQRNLEFDVAHLTCKVSDIGIDCSAGLSGGCLALQKKPFQVQARHLRKLMELERLERA